MANIAQLVNNLHSLFLADGDRFVATPTFHVFEMYKPHHEAKAVKIDVQAPEVAFKSGGQDRKLFRIAGAASVKEQALTLTLVHTHVREPAEMVLRLSGGKADTVRQTVLAHEKLNAHNTFENPTVVTPKSMGVKEHGEAIKCVPPASVVRLDVRLG